MPPKRYHFKAGEIVITPTKRRAMLMEYNYHTGRWELRYLDESAETVSLLAALLVPE